MRQLFQKLFNTGKEAITNPRKMLGSAGIKRRVGLFSMYMGAGYGASALLDHQIGVSRNYYGAEEFDKSYGEGANLPGNIAKYGVGWLMGGMSLFDRDYISRARNTFRLHTGKGRRAQNLLKSKRPVVRTIWGEGPDWHRTTQISEPFNTSKHPIAMARIEAAKRTIKRRKEVPQFGLLQMATLSGWTGGSGIAGQYVGTGAGVLGGIALTGLGITGIAKLGLERTVFGSTMVGLGGYAGLKMGRRPSGGAAEGNITSFESNNSVVRRMNFSTAGLVQALDRNNRRY